MPRGPSRSPAVNVRTRIALKIETPAMSNEPEQDAPFATTEITIVNELGLHARPAAEFVRCASQFRSEIFLVRDDRRLSAASMIEVLMADLSKGESAQLEALGPDADTAVETLAQLISSFQD